MDFKEKLQSEIKMLRDENKPEHESVVNQLQWIHDTFPNRKAYDNYLIHQMFNEKMVQENYRKQNPAKQETVDRIKKYFDIWYNEVKDDIEKLTWFRKSFVDAWSCGYLSINSKPEWYDQDNLISMEDAANGVYQTVFWRLENKVVQRLQELDPKWEGFI